MSGIKTVRVRVVGLIFLLPSNTVSTAIEPMAIVGVGRSRAIPLFAGQHQTFVARRGAGVGLKNAVAGLEVSTPRDGFVRRSRSRIEFSNVVVRFVIEQQEINK
jgi:hypothetical protein